MQCITKKNVHWNHDQDLAYAMDTNDSGDIDLPEFLLLMAKRMADSNIEEDITEAFKVFYNIWYSSMTI